MRILYVSADTPLLPKGGIATYLSFMVPAMRAAGHDVYLFSWTETQGVDLPQDTAPFAPDHVHVETFDFAEVRRSAPVTDVNLSRALHLQSALQRRVREWEIDVIEATDFQAPALSLFQQIQTRAGNARQLCVTYNHGFIEDYLEADYIVPPAGQQLNVLGERQQCRVSDLVLTPSRHSQRNLESFGIRDNVIAVREPYRFTSNAPLEQVRPDLTYIGRASLSKGVDKIVYWANAVHPVFPLDRVRLIGRLVDTPFDPADLATYVSGRLIPGLRDRLELTGMLPRAEALALLEPGALCPSLGSAETFSYACVESIDHGLLPVLRHDTPMVEFLPEDLHHLVLDARMGSVREMQQGLAQMIDDAGPILKRIREHCQETLAPERIANHIADLYADALERKADHRRTSARATTPASMKDVTVLVTARDPGPALRGTLASLAAQTAGPPRVLVCHDEPGGALDLPPPDLPEIGVLDQPGVGICAARNTLIDLCTTPLAILLDAGDCLTPDALPRMLTAYAACPRHAHAIIPQRRPPQDGARQDRRNLLHDHLHLLDNDFLCTALIETQVLRAIGFDGTRRNGEDAAWPFWLEFTARGYCGAMLPEPVLIHTPVVTPTNAAPMVGTRSLLRRAADFSPSQGTVLLTRALQSLAHRAGTQKK